MGDQITANHRESAKNVHIIINSATKIEQEKTMMKPLKAFHAGYFRICLSLGGQALLWKALSDKDISKCLPHFSIELPSVVYLFLWYIALCTLIVLSVLYTLRCIFYFHLVKAEFVHFIGVNYMFTPWTSWLLLLQSVPILQPKESIYQGLCMLFVIPLLILDVKIYGQWFTTEKRFLSVLANPTSQISVIGNLVAARTAAQMGWKESATCIFTLGMTHYLVVFITLYQHLSGGDHLPVRLRPVYFSFVAAPSMASLAWSSISGTFDTPSKMLFFLSLFLFTSLASRPALFKKAMKKFNVAWWAYSFPLTFLAMASSAYAQEVKGIAASGLVFILTVLSVFIFICLLLSSALNIDMLLRGSDPILKFDSKGK
ncbi:S-type anion channel SLAH1 [Heracleum sosnowskyi]|uniref:S-type anion channel SLAH1 n=1 Tax=Heracleum sosnowskyi TaxID=360622 RepID=A0AAD8MDK6_9APIA|nr:S-type anion channel SLAH1 [Heracleum sosnowskyi]